jgi:hypothetical protein
MILFVKNIRERKLKGISKLNLSFDNKKKLNGTG